MGIRCSATLKVEFEMEDGQPDGLAKIVLTREVQQFQSRIERGNEVGRTGVKRGSASVQIIEQDYIGNG